MSGLVPPYDDTVRLSDMAGVADPTQPDGIFNDDTEQIIPYEIATENQNGIQQVADPAVIVIVKRTENEFIGRKKSYVIVAVLLCINLLNYMDRFTVAGVLYDIRQYYDLGDQESGLLQTVFIGSYMILSPVFGYLGDRYNRKHLMMGGIAFWTAITLASSFVPKHLFGVFLWLRGMVGIGEASYSTIAPTIIADLFVHDMRTKMLAIFYFAIPVGSGLGYVVGSEVAKLFGEWQYALRVTPVLGVVCLVLIFFLVREPSRGQAEGGAHLHSTDYLSDLRYLVRNKSFMLSTFGFTAVAFVTGALALWAPLYVYYSIRIQDPPGDLDKSTVSLIFGGITCAAGIIGVAAGAESARRYRKVNPRADPLVCAFGLITCMPFLYISLVVSEYSTTVTWILIFVGETLLCLNWSIVADILLGVVIPTRRSTAEAFQILVSHLLGDAGSPYLVGLVSDMVRGHNPEVARYEFVSLQYALYMTAFVAVLGGGGFLATALFYQKDRKTVELVVAKGLEQGLRAAAAEEILSTTNSSSSAVENSQPPTEKNEIA